MASVTNHISNLTLVPDKCGSALPLSVLTGAVPLMVININSRGLPTTCLRYSGTSNVERVISRLIRIRRVGSVTFINNIGNKTYTENASTSSIISHCSTFGGCLRRHKLSSGKTLLSSSFTASSRCVINLYRTVKSNELPRTLIYNASRATFNIVELLRRTNIQIPSSIVIAKFSKVLTKQLVRPRLAAIHRPVRSVKHRTTHVLLSEGKRP